MQPLTTVLAALLPQVLLQFSEPVVWATGASSTTEKAAAASGSGVVALMGHALRRLQQITGGGTEISNDTPGDTAGAGGSGTNTTSAGGEDGSSLGGAVQQSMPIRSNQARLLNLTGDTAGRSYIAWFDTIPGKGTAHSQSRLKAHIFWPKHELNKTHKMSSSEGNHMHKPLQGSQHKCGCCLRATRTWQATQGAQKTACR